ncbi:MAG: hypothetical protein ACKO5P_02755 [Nodosilinea sp.]
MLYLIIVIGPIPLGLCLLALAQLCQSRRSLSYFLLVIFTVWVTAQIILGLLLGSFGLLNIKFVIFTEIILFTIGFFLLHATKKQIKVQGKYDLYGFLICFDKRELLILNTIILVGGFSFITLLIRVIVDYDSVWFHLPAIARWYQTGSLTLLDSSGHWIFEHPDASRYPYNWHILGLLCLLPFRQDLLVALPIFLAWVMLGLAVYLLSREFGAQRFYSLAATALVLSIPMMLDRVNTFQVDLPLAAMVLTGLYFAYSSHKTRSQVEFALFLAAMGTMLGLRINGIVYVVSIAGFWGCLELTRWLTKPPSSPPVTKPVGLIVLLGWFCFFLLSSYWYIRNYRDLQAALAEVMSFKVAALSLPSLPGPIDGSQLLKQFNQLQRTTLTYQFRPGNPSHWQILASQTVSRLQLPFIAMGLQVLLLPSIALRYPKLVIQRSFIYLILLVLLTGFLYWNTPYSSGADGRTAGVLSPLLGYNLRYGFPFIGMLAVATAVIATIARTPSKLVLAVVWLSGILGIVNSSLFDTVRAVNFKGESSVWLSGLIQNLLSAPEKVIDLVMQSMGQNLLSLLVYVSFYIGITLLLYRYFLTSHPLTQWRLDPSFVFSKKYRSGWILVSLLLVIFVFAAAQPIKSSQRRDVYRDISQYLEQATPSKAPIAYFSSPRSYLLYGQNLNKTVLHPLPNLDDPGRWVKKLQRDGVNWVAVGPSLHPGSPRGQFLQSLIDAGVLSLDFGQDPLKELVIYRLQTANQFNRSPAASP